MAPTKKLFIFGFIIFASLLFFSFSKNVHAFPGDSCTDPSYCDTGEGCDTTLEECYVLVGGTDCSTYNAGSCAFSDPCHWANDGGCDDACNGITSSPFDDSVDCGGGGGGGTAVNCYDANDQNIACNDPLAATCYDSNWVTVTCPGGGGGGGLCTSGSGNCRLGCNQGESPTASPDPACDSAEQCCVPSNTTTSSDCTSGSGNCRLGCNQGESPTASPDPACDSAEQCCVASGTATSSACTNGAGNCRLGGCSQGESPTPNPDPVCDSAEQCCVTNTNVPINGACAGGNLNCSSSCCVGGTCRTATTCGANVGTSGTCTGNSNCSSSCCVGGTCRAAATCSATGTNPGGTPGGNPGGTPGGNPGGTAPGNNGVTYNGPLATIHFGNPLQATSVNQFLTMVLGSLQGIIAILSVIFIVIGGIMYITSAGNETAITRAKSTITAALVGLAIALAAPSFLSEIMTILGSNVPGPAAPTLRSIALRTLSFLLSVVGIIGIIGLVIGGYSYVTAYGNEKKIDTAKTIIKYSLIGIVVALAAVILVRQVATILGVA